MTTQIQRRRGTTAQHSTFTGAVGEVTVDTDKEVLVVHDGAQAGGYPQMRENGSNSALSLGSAATPSLKFAGDTNTGIYSPGADQVAISTNGTGRLFVDSNGRVGVGVSNPAFPLQINGSACVAGTSDNIFFGVDDNTSPRVGLVKQAGGSPLFAAGSATAFVFAHSSGTSISSPSTQTYTERARIDSSGRLLVGTSSDSGGALLQVNGDRIRVGTAKTPASATATGTAGEICWDASYVYVCTATNTWKRSALSTW